jgi:hypothetical protein
MVLYDAAFPVADSRKFLGFQVRLPLLSAAPRLRRQFAWRTDSVSRVQSGDYNPCVAWFVRARAVEGACGGQLRPTCHTRSDAEDPDQQSRR